MKLYYSPGACSLAVRIVIHELGLACEYERVDLKTKVTETGKNFLDTNPKGAVPTLQLDNGDILTENQVIQQYLVDTYSGTLLPPVGQMKRYRVLEWLNFVSMDLHKSFSPFFNPAISEGLRASIFRPILKSKLLLVNAHLASRSFLLGDYISLPDAYLFVVSRWLGAAGFKISEFPHVEKFFNGMKQRATVQAALKEESL